MAVNGEVFFFFCSYQQQQRHGASIMTYPPIAPACTWTGPTSGSNFPFSFVDHLTMCFPRLQRMSSHSWSTSALHTPESFELMPWLLYNSGRSILPTGSDMNIYRSRDPQRGGKKQWLCKHKVTHLLLMHYFFKPITRTCSYIVVLCTPIKNLLITHCFQDVLFIILIFRALHQKT